MPTRRSRPLASSVEEIARRSARRGLLLVALALCAAGAPAAAADEASTASAAALAAAEPATTTTPGGEAAATAPAEQTAPETPQFLAVLRVVPRLHQESAWTAAEQEAVGRHFQRLLDAAKEGHVLLAGRTQEPLDRTFGLIVFEAADEAAARVWAEADPAVVAGVMTVTVHPYAVAVARD